MKNCVKLILLLVIFISSNSTSMAQELVKPVPNVVAKQADKNTVSSTENVSPVNTNSGTSSGTKLELDSAYNATPINSTNNVLITNPSNATQDTDDYQAKKMEWINNNPEKYKAMSGNPNLIILTQQELNGYSEQERNRILADEINYLIIR